MSINYELHNMDDYMNIHIQLTEYCPMGCKGCYQETLNNKNYLDSIDALNGILKILKDYKPKEFKLSFFGGEPLLRIDNIISIISHMDTMLINFKLDSKLKEINIPTSGGVNLKNYGKELLESLPTLINLSNYLKVKLNISISHDGINNFELRNIPVEEVTGLIKKVYEIENKTKSNITSQYISCVIPQNITEDYFIDNFEYFLDNLFKPCTFTIPHLLHKDGILYKEPEIFRKAIRKFLEKYYGTNEYNFHKPKIFEDLENKVKTKHKYNWCGAGVNHIAIKTDGFSTGCEYLKENSIELLNKMDKTCIECEIKDYCQRPCLKNMEVDKEQFLAQCVLRKYLFLEYREILNKKGLKK